MQHLHSDFDAELCLNRTFFLFFLGSICTSDRCAHFISKSSIHIQLHFHNELPCVLGCAVCMYEKYLQTLRCMLKGIYGLHYVAPLTLLCCLVSQMDACVPEANYSSLFAKWKLLMPAGTFIHLWEGEKNGSFFFFFNSSLFSKLRQSRQRGEFKGVEVGRRGRGVAQDLKTRICLIPYTEVMDGCEILYARTRTSQHLSPPHPWAVEDIDQVLCDRLPQSSTSFSTCFCLFFSLPSALSKKAHHTHFHISFKSELCGFHKK